MQTLASQFLSSFINVKYTGKKLIKSSIKPLYFGSVLSCKNIPCNTESKSIFAFYSYKSGLPFSLYIKTPENFQKNQLTRCMPQCRGKEISFFFSLIARLMAEAPVTKDRLTRKYKIHLTQIVCVTGAFRNKDSKERETSVFLF